MREASSVREISVTEMLSEEVMEGGAGGEAGGGAGNRMDTVV